MDSNQINNNINNNQTNQANNEANNEKKGRGLFYGVIAIAVFIIMAVGATYAYFTATTNSMDSAVRTGSTTLQLQFISYGEAWMNNDLIPADTNIVEYSFEGQNDTTESDTTIQSNMQCKDDYGNSICSVYVFQVRNTAASPQSVALEIASTSNEFASLNAMTYELSLPDPATDYNDTEGDDNKNGNHDPLFKTSSDDQTENSIGVTTTQGGLTDTQSRILSSTEYDPIYVNRKGVNKTLLKYIESTDESNGTTVMKPSIDRHVVQITDLNQDSDISERKIRLADNITIDSRTTKTFAIVLYIKNENRDQTGTDASKIFNGQVIVSSGDGSTGVSGVISTAAGQELQSDQP